MGTLYVGQDVQLTLQTYTDVSSATTLQIRVRKPDATTESMTATAVSDTSARINLADTDIDQAGGWFFQAYAEIGGKKYFGRTFQQEVKAVWT